MTGPASHPGAALGDAALACLRDERGTTGTAAPFTSNLTVDEAVLLAASGHPVLALVSGAGVYHLGRVHRPWFGNGEVTQLTTALYQARAAAVANLTAAAAEAGGDGVAGVRLDLGFMGSTLVRFVATGTALQHPPPDLPAPRSYHLKKDPAPPTEPFTCHLSGQQLVLLLGSGYQPLRLVMGGCVYHVGHRRPVEIIRSATSDFELADFTQATYEARSLAMERLQHEATAAGADGVVGVDVITATHVWGPRIIEFLAIGTAVRRVNDAKPSTPKLFVDLNQGRAGADPDALRQRHSGTDAVMAKNDDRLNARLRESGIGMPWRVTLTACWALLWIAVVALVGHSAVPHQLPDWLQALFAVTAIGWFTSLLLTVAGRKLSFATGLVTTTHGVGAAVAQFGYPGRHPVGELIVFLSSPRSISLH